MNCSHVTKAKKLHLLNLVCTLVKLIAFALKNFFVCGQSDDRFPILTVGLHHEIDLFLEQLEMADCTHLPTVSFDDLLLYS